MKYEMIFGDEKLFDGAPDECFCVAKNVYGDRIFYKAECRSLFRLDNAEWKPLQFMSCTPLAMRRIIKEPKRWTWEDKKAGRLPEVGCKCVGILSEAIKRVVHVNKHIVAVENEKTLNVCNFTHEEFFRNHKPIETPAEKAQRFESEWVESAFDAVMIVGVHSTEDIQRIKNHLRTIYRAQLSGELAAPKGGE